MADDAPILIAYDGSPAAQAAVRAAGALFAPRRAIVLTVWEPGLAEFMLVPDSTGMGSTMLPYDPAVARNVARVSEDHAKDVAGSGATLAGTVGLDAEPLAMEDVTQAADAIVTQADEHLAAAIVIGSRGLTGLKSKLLGSTSTDVLHRASRPVVVVRQPHEPGEG
jgi:nucleotide-binding universal stress UspA family protein